MALFRIFRGHTDFDMMHLEVMREIIKRSRELLANTLIPDTFAGRKTQEPFPQENPGDTAKSSASKTTFAIIPGKFPTAELPLPTTPH